jgi:hypothetical protein
MEEGKVYKIGSADGDMIVKLIEIRINSMFPSDYLFKYQEGSNKPIIHPNAEVLFGSKDIFPLPEGLIPIIKEKYGIVEV